MGAYPPSYRARARLDSFLSCINLTFYGLAFHIIKSCGYMELTTDEPQGYSL